MSNPVVQVSKEAELAVVAVNRPEVKNALSNAVLDELEQVMGYLEADEAIKGIVLTSSDGALAGADIKELAQMKTPEEAAAKARRGQVVIDRIAALKKPVVAALNGPVLGGGAELSMGCHARVVGPGLLLGQPEVNLGIIPGYGGTQRLPRLIGLERAVDLLRTGRPIKTADACAWGWAQPHPADEPVPAAQALLRRHLAGELKLAPVDPAPLPLPAALPEVDIGHHSTAIDAILVDVLNQGLTRPLPEGLKVEAEGFARCASTEDFAIGMKNFIEKGPRSPAEFVHR